MKRALTGPGLSPLTPLPPEQEAKLLFVMRLRGINGMHPKTRKIMQVLRLLQINNGTFMKVNKATMNMLVKVRAAPPKKPLTEMEPLRSTLRANPATRLPPQPPRAGEEAVGARRGGAKQLRAVHWRRRSSTMPAVSRLPCPPDFRVPFPSAISGPLSPSHVRPPFPPGDPPGTIHLHTSDGRNGGRTPPGSTTPTHDEPPSLRSHACCATRGLRFRHSKRFRPPTIRKCEHARTRAGAA